jgi:hypothetical protein
VTLGSLTTVDFALHRYKRRYGNIFWGIFFLAGIKAHHSLVCESCGVVLVLEVGHSRCMYPSFRVFVFLWFGCTFLNHCMCQLFSFRV